MSFTYREFSPELWGFNGSRNVIVAWRCTRCGIKTERQFKLQKGNIRGVQISTYIEK